ncbi:unnamed protein product [Hymenolepis diminuta]|nr:unnamed protein product [Hymenolepis diminuta]
MENPTILKELHCTWNLQMYEPVRSDNCWSTWNRSPGDGIESPKLLHADAVNKAENEFQALEPSALAKNVGDIKKRYIAIRSQYHLMNGYMFRHSPIEPPAFDIGRIMKRSYPDRQLLNSEKLCKSHWSFLKTWCQGVHHFVYNIYNRIHPLYVYQNHPILTNNSNQISLVVSVDFNKSFNELETVASQWPGVISAAILASDLEAHQFLGKVERSIVLKQRNNIFYHIVYRNSSFPENIALHNTAVNYAPTKRVLLIPKINANLAALGALISTKPTKNESMKVLVPASEEKFACYYIINDLCALVESTIPNLKDDFKQKLIGLVISTNGALLPNELEKLDRSEQLMALVANQVL